MRRFSVLFIALSLILSACGTLQISLETPPPEIFDVTEIPAGSAPEATIEPGLSLASTSDEIQHAMLESATNWLSIWMDGTVTQFALDGTNAPAQVSREQVWIDLPNSRFRILSGPAEGAAETFKASDGVTILEMDLKTGKSQSYAMPELGEEKQFVPTLKPGYAYPQPLWGQIGTPLSELAFTSDLAQNEGTFKPIAMEFVAGREALVVEWTYIKNDLPSWRMWLDTKTAVILKIQDFGKGGGENIQRERVFNQVVYDDIFADPLFRAPTSLPQFSDISGRPLTASEPAATASSDPDPLGEVYFFIADHVYGKEKVEFVRVPGSCVAGLNACPEAQVISTPFDPKFSLTSLIWSPKGDVAAFAYPISEDGNRAALFLFDPQAETWESLAEFNFIDPPFWSSDGNWLAFRVQDGNGNEDIYVVRRDGSQLTNLTASEDLPDEDRPYLFNGWINNGVILRGSRAETVYLMRVEDGSVKKLFETPWAKSDFVPSPDGYFLAYMDVADQNTSLKLFTPDGKPVRDLASFQNSSIYPIVWSRDGSSLAFVQTTNDLTSGQDVYITGRDGQGLKQVYHSVSGSIAEVMFSPDGKHLLLRDDDATGRHIFIIDLETLKQHMLQVPGLPLDWWWLAPSWKP